jgi:hypothetical protein
MLGFSLDRKTIRMPHDKSWATKAKKLGHRRMIPPSKLDEEKRILVMKWWKTHRKLLGRAALWTSVFWIYLVTVFLFQPGWLAGLAWLIMPGAYAAGVLVATGFVDEGSLILLILFFLLNCIFYFVVAIVVLVLLDKARMRGEKNRANLCRDDQ